MTTVFGAFSSRPHVIFVLVDDWGYELWPGSANHAQLLPQVFSRELQQPPREPGKNSKQH